MKTRRRCTASTLAATVVAMSSANAFAGIVVHTTYSSWSAAVGGGDAKIDFDLRSGQDLLDQHAALGVRFGGTLQRGTTQGSPVADGRHTVTDHCDDGGSRSPCGFISERRARGGGLSAFVPFVLFVVHSDRHLVREPSFSPFA
jgi:hypothetical protein